MENNNFTTRKFCIKKMKFKQLFTERRAYEKEGVEHETYFSQLKEICEKYGYENVYIQYTDTDKFGLNPTNNYNTPTGIYAYPMSKYKERLQKQGYFGVPFANERSYVNIFTVKSGKILNINKYSSANWDIDMKKLRKYYNDIPKKDIVMTCDGIEEIILDSNKYANVKTIGGKFWYITMFLTLCIKGENNENLWSSILHKVLNYSGIVDYGEGIIHEAEPTQAIFFSKNNLQLIARVKNIKKRNYEYHAIYQDVKKYIKVVNAINKLIQKIPKNNIIKTLQLYVDNDPKKDHYKNIDSLLKLTKIQAKHYYDNIYDTIEEYLYNLEFVYQFLINNKTFQHILEGKTNVQHTSIYIMPNKIQFMGGQFTGILDGGILQGVTWIDVQYKSGQLIDVYDKDNKKIDENTLIKK